MNRSVTLAMLIAAVFVQGSACGAAKSQSTQHVNFEADYRKQLDAFISQLRASPAAVPGTVVVAAHGDRTVFEKAYFSHRLLRPQSFKKTSGV